MNKEEYLRELDEIIEDKMFIGNDINDLETESSQNTWSISMSQQLASEFTVWEIRNFFKNVITNKAEQLTKANCNHGMLFYVWFDFQSGRLRFNFISNIHKRLPFKCEIETIENMDSIIYAFLEYPYHDGIPFEEEIDKDEASVENTEVNLLHVFLYELRY
ncbi:hypothetical protein [Paenibacillus paridis]|uniref:hypothetical protein n=1 Tax=Paenibacillus paridis TaxID=2583376 RepID=UPI00192E5EB0|nr:hypothetical protein [Paenibacillus paridis]